MSKLFEKTKVIPIFFATDDNYIPFLDVAIRSVIKNASKKYKYEINILNTGLNDASVAKIQRLQDANFAIKFFDVSEKLKGIKCRLKDIYHFTIAMYYRLFIEGLFPQYDKAIYLDCDIVVLGDISKLYNIKLNKNLVGAVSDQVVNSNEVFKSYAHRACGIVPNHYFNSGVLLMNLKKFREHKVQDKFVDLLKTYNFDVVDPDQAYLNVLCKDRVKYLPNGWNKESLHNRCEGKLNIVHYALYKKPWQYDDVLNGQYFWEYAKESPFYNEIIETKNAFTEDKKREKECANKKIVDHAIKFINTDKNFSKCIFNKMSKKKDVLWLIDELFSEKAKVGV